MTACRRTIPLVALVIVCSLLTSCVGRLHQEPVPHDIGLLLFERRIDGAGPAPNIVKVYLTNIGTTPRTDDIPIFEGQDMDKICYKWNNKNELHIRNSDGFVDRISQKWGDGKGRTVKLVFDGTNDCSWK